MIECEIGEWRLISDSIEGIDYRGYATLDQGISVEGQVVYYFSNAVVCFYPPFEKLLSFR